MKKQKTSSAVHADPALEHFELALARKAKIRDELAQLKKFAREIQRAVEKVKEQALPDKEERRWQKQLARLLKRETELYGKLVEVIGLVRTIPARRLKPLVLTCNSRTTTFSDIAKYIEFPQDMRICVWCASDCTNNCTSDCMTNCPNGCAVTNSSGCPYSASIGKYMQHDKRLPSKSIRKAMKLLPNGGNPSSIDWG